ncbi:MAG: RNA polymerase sigma factor [Chitinophagaceae bacterium]
MTNINNDNIIVSIADLKAKDKKAFENLYDKYSGALFNIILRIVNSNEVAEDVLQESFLKIWKNIDSYDDGKATIFTWMMNVCRNTALDSLRKTNARPSIKTDTDNPVVSNLQTTQMNTDSIGLKNSLKYLTPEQNVVIQAVYFNGLTQEEASKALDIPLGTVKTRIRNGLITLKNVFKN